MEKKVDGKMVKNTLNFPNIKTKQRVKTHVCGSNDDLCEPGCCSHCPVGSKLYKCNGPQNNSFYDYSMYSFECCFYFCKHFGNCCGYCFDGICEKCVDMTPIQYLKCCNAAKDALLCSECIFKCSKCKIIKCTAHRTEYDEIKDKQCDTTCNECIKKMEKKDNNFWITDE